MGKSVNPLLMFILIFSLCGFLCAEPLSENFDSAARQGYEALRNEDWTSAAVFLRKAVSVPMDSTDENYFMLIKSEIYSGEYKMAQEDCERFLEKFPLSIYVPHVQYQNGRMLHLLGKNDEAVIALGDFCKQHYDEELYPLALFWIAEAFYDEYNFGSAKGLYARLVNEFPNSAKAKDAQYKLDLIAQRAREEKLLYLLKVIGEENLSTREEYERQLKVYQTEKEYGNKSENENEIAALQARISELETLLAEKNGEKSGSDEKASASVQMVNEPSLHLIRKKNYSENKDSEALKQKSEQIPYMQNIIDDKTDGEK